MAYSTSFAMASTSSRVVSIPWAVRPCSCTAATTSSSVPRVCQPHWQVTSFIVCFSSFLQHTQYGHSTSISEEVKSEHLTSDGICSTRRELFRSWEVLQTHPSPKVCKT